MSPRAGLPMYDLPEVRAATDALWAALRARLAAHGVAAPAALDRGGDLTALWTDAGLALAQTCGLPFVRALRDRVRLVATPCYDAEGCEGPLYRSALLVRAGDPAETLADLRGGVAAFNGADSQSGWNALRAVAAPLAEDGRFFARTIETGAHRRSMAAVATGAADLCAVDCVTLALLRAHAPNETAALRVLAWSPAAPALPYVTAAEGAQLDAVRAATLEALSAPETAEARAVLLIAGAEVLPESAYDAVAAMDAGATAAGYPALA